MTIHRDRFILQTNALKITFSPSFRKTGGQTLEEAFEQVVIAMFGYMTNLESVSIQSHMDIEVEGIDMLSLLFQFLDEFLFNFSCEPNFIPRVSCCQIHFPDNNFCIPRR
jgi:hypothetical protein